MESNPTWSVKGTYGNGAPRPVKEPGLTDKEALADMQLMLGLMQPHPKQKAVREWIFSKQNEL